jgi:glycopeptide antibiotics resistance protein
LRTPFYKKLLATVFVVYLLVVAAATILPERVGRLQAPHSSHINVVPLSYSFECLFRTRRAHPDLTGFCVRNTLGNVVLFLPLGFLLPILSERFRRFRRMLLTAALLSLSIETIQFLLRFVGNDRAVDIDDVLLNTLGGLLGFGIYKLGIALLGPKGERDKSPTTS